MEILKRCKLLFPSPFFPINNVTIKGPILPWVRRTLRCGDFHRIRLNLQFTEFCLMLFSCSVVSDSLWPMDCRTPGVSVLLFWMAHAYWHPRWHSVKSQPASAGDAGDSGWIPGWGWPPGIENGNPLQYSCLENLMDRGAWWATGHGVPMSWTWLSTHVLLPSYYVP